MKNNIVTGAFGYIGKYIAQRLIDQGAIVKNLTSHPNRPSPFGKAVESFEYDFDRPERLVSHLQGAETLYNTYWIRFPYRSQTYEQALRNTERLFSAATEAKVRRIVHISVTNASVNSTLPYYRGKGIQEALLGKYKAEYSIVRPTLVFGKEDILVNNIGWLIRRFPVFPIFGNGKYQLQPVCVEDVARIAIDVSKAPPSTIVDAIGPETYTFEQFVSLIAANLNSRSRPVRIAPRMGIAMGKLIGLTRGDVLLTSNELRGLMSNFLTSHQVPNGTIRFSEWLVNNKDSLGTSYTSEIERHFRR